MDQTTILPYFLALVAVTASPGPMVAVIVTRTLSHDLRGAAAFAAGVCLGDMIAILVIALGFGAWSQGSPEWLAVLRFAGVAYLLWLSLQIWRDSQPGGATKGPRRGVLASTGAGVALCLGNPATFVFYLLLLPSAAPEGLSSTGALIGVLLVSLAAVGTALGGMTLLAGQLRRIITTPAASAMFSRLMAVLLATTSMFLLAA